MCLREQLQEFGSKYESEALRNQKKLDLADVLIYVYDSSDTNSFSYISNLRVSVRDGLYVAYIDVMSFRPTATILAGPYPKRFRCYQIRHGPCAAAARSATGRVRAETGFASAHVRQCQAW